MIILLEIVFYAIQKKVLITSIKNNRECKTCNVKRVLKRYYNIKEKILQQRRDEFARFKDLDNRLEALEEKLSVKTISTNKTQKSIKNFINEILSKPPKKNYPTSKTHKYHSDDIWNSDLSDLRITALRTIKVIDMLK